MQSRSFISIGSGFLDVFARHSLFSSRALPWVFCGRLWPSLCFGPYTAPYACNARRLPSYVTFTFAVDFLSHFVMCSPMHASCRSCAFTLHLSHAGPCVSPYTAPFIRPGFLVGALLRSLCVHRECLPQPHHVFSNSLYSVFHVSFF